MGYACPVCEVPQRDAEHLANHLAFTAMLHAGDHEAWLDETVPEWADSSPTELAADVVEFADEAVYDEVFEDTVHGHSHSNGHGHDHEGGGDHAHSHDHRDDHGGATDRPAVEPAAAARRGAGEPDDETAAILREARELTRRMYASADDEASGVDDPGGEESGDGPTGDEPTSADGAEERDDDSR
jgi:hypothetical protein